MRTKWGRRGVRREADSVVDNHSDVASGPLQVIDRALSEFAGRRNVSSGEVVDLLLDVRLAVVLDATVAALLDELEERHVSTAGRGR